MMGRRWRAKCSSVHGVYNARDDGLDRGYQKREAFATITNDCIEPVSPVHWLGRCAYLPHSTSKVWWRVRNTLSGGGNKVELERPLAVPLVPPQSALRDREGGIWFPSNVWSATEIKFRF
jgi:hypothetical protein